MFKETYKFWLLDGTTEIKTFKVGWYNTEFNEYYNSNKNRIGSYMKLGYFQRKRLEKRVDT